MEVDQLKREPRHSMITEMRERFPLHVQRDWMEMHPTISRTRQLFLRSDDEQTIRLESKIIPQELIEVADLLMREETYEKRFEHESGEGGIAQEYKRLRIEAQEHGVTEPLLRQALALSIVAAKKVYSTPDTPFDVWDTQRIALLRITKNLLNEQSPGLIEDLRTGMGKSSVLSMITLPVGFLVKNHWDMISRTPLSRTQNAQRFAPLGDLLGIRNVELTSATTRFWKERISFSLISKSKDSRTYAMQPDTVTFATRQDIAPYLLQNFAKGKFAELQKVISPQDRGCILDEFDAETLDEGTTNFIIAGEALPTRDVVHTFWRPSRYPTDTVDSLLSLYDRMSEKEFKRKLKTLQEQMDGDIKEATHLLKHVTDDEQTVFSFALLRKFLSFEPELIAQHVFQGDNPFFTLDGQLTSDGEYSMLRRLYSFAVGIPYDGKELIPSDWEDFLSMTIPSHIVATIGRTLRLKNGTDYFVKDGKIVVQSPLTGWPKERQEFDALTTFALYAKESLHDTTLVYPTVLHETADSLSPPELEAILYSKIIGLTGTGIPVARWFRATRGMDITAIPPQYKETINRINPYICVKPGELKIDALERYIQTLPNTSIPFLIDVTSPEEQQEVITLLERLYPEEAKNRNIQRLSATNVQEAQAIFKQAGGEGKKSVVLLMAGREVDIPVDDSIEAFGGLHVVSMAPRTIKRNEFQLIGRTGRAGKSGVYRCFVSPDDEVFSLLSKEDKEEIITVMRRDDASSIEHVIRKGQKKFEEQLQERNMQFARIYRPLVFIRRRMLELTPDQFEAVRIFWQDFLTIQSVYGTAMGTHATPQRYSSEQLELIWKPFVVNLFESALTQATELLQQGGLNNKQIRNRIAETMGESIENFGFFQVPSKAQTPKDKKTVRRLLEKIRSFKKII